MKANQRHSAFIHSSVWLRETDTEALKKAEALKNLKVLVGFS
jgi:hypothetical protein